MVNHCYRQLFSLFIKEKLQHIFRTHFKDDCLKLAIECHKLEPKTHVWLGFFIVLIKASL